MVQRRINHQASSFTIGEKNLISTDVVDIIQDTADRPWAVVIKATVLVEYSMQCRATHYKLVFLATQSPDKPDSPEDHSYCSLLRTWDGRTCICLVFYSELPRHDNLRNIMNEIHQPFPVS